MFPSESQFLVVDDSSAIRTLIRHQLASIGFHKMIEADNGHAAIDLLEKTFKKGSKVDVILCDWKMPSMAGPEFLTFLKKHDSYKNIPFIMVAGENDVENVAKVLKLGALDFILKPFDEGQLKEKLESAWNLRNETG